MNKFKNISIFLLFFGMFFNSAFSQSMYDLSGVYTGEHIEFSRDNPNDSMSYLYKFDFEQDGDLITGQSNIYNDAGYYATVQIRGLIVDNVVYFEEYETLDEVNPEGSDWCHNSGHLDIVKEGDRLTLSGITKSFTKDYGIFCSDGYTNVFKILDDEEDLSPDLEVEKVSKIFIERNPTDSETALNFVLNESADVVVEVYNLAGELKLDILDRELFPDSYSIPIDLSFKEDGMYIVELIVDKKLYSKELWKTKP